MSYRSQAGVSDLERETPGEDSWLIPRQGILWGQLGARPGDTWVTRQTWHSLRAPAQVGCQTFHTEK